MRPQPYAHQERALELSKDREAFALLLEMGLGKTRVALDTASHLYRSGKIRALLVIAPNGVHTTWSLSEIPTHLDVPFVARHWDASRAGRTKYDRWLRSVWLPPPPGTLPILCVNVESLSAKRGRDVASSFVEAHGGDVLLVVDESALIKTPSAKRTKAVLALGKRAAYRRILTGTPVTQSPLDVYTQFKFLDPRILGFDSFYAFKAHFCVLVKRRASSGSRSWQYEEVLGYRRLDELQRLIASASFRATKAECLDLPDKLYSRIVVALSPAQRSRYDSLVSDYVLLTASEERVPVPMALTRLLRMQQVTAGFLPDETETRVEPIPGSNPKIEALISDVETIPDDESVIVWCRFRAELEAAASALREAHGRGSVGTYYGSTTPEDRTSLIEAFQSRRVRFFVGTPQSAGLGLTLTAARHVYYLSNGFSSSDRMQSEDRAHRIGQTSRVRYVDVVCKGTIDERVLDVLRDKRDVAAMIVGDPRSIIPEIVRDDEIF